MHICIIFFSGHRIKLPSYPSASSSAGSRTCSICALALLASPSQRGNSTKGKEITKANPSSLSSSIRSKSVSVASNEEDTAASNNVPFKRSKSESGLGRSASSRDGEDSSSTKSTAGGRHRVKFDDFKIELQRITMELESLQELGNSNYSFNSLLFDLPYKFGILRAGSNPSNTRGPGETLPLQATY